MAASVAFGFAPWRKEARTPLFRALFTGPLSPGIDAPAEIGFGDLLKADYPYRPSEADTFPDDVDAAYTTLAQQIYLVYLGRPAEPAGLVNFAKALRDARAPTTLRGLEVAYDSNPTVKSLLDSVANSQEAASLYGNDTAAFISGIFRNAFNRTPEQGGLNFWVNAVNANGLSKGRAGVAIAASAAANADGAAVRRRTAVVLAFTNGLDTPAEVAAYGGVNVAKVKAMLAQVNGTTDLTAFQSTIDATLIAIMSGR